MEFNKYIGIYPTSGAVQSAIDEGQLHKPYIAIVQDGNYIDWNNLSSTLPYSAVPLTFSVISAGTIEFIMGTGATASTISYRVNNGTWSSITSTTGGTSFNVNSGDIVEFKGNGLKNRNTSTGKTSQIVGTAKVIAYGNPYSLLTANYANATSCGDYALSCLFTNNKGLINAENLVLPGTTIGAAAYAGMFQFCSNLEKGPTVIPGNYPQMGYNYMFRGDSKLTNAPEFTNTGGVQTLCLKSAFEDCSKINRIKCLATDISAVNCTKDWLKGVSSTGTFIKNPNMTSWTSGVDGIPTNWTVIDADL